MTYLLRFESTAHLLSISLNVNEPLEAVYYPRVVALSSCHFRLASLACLSSVRSHKRAGLSRIITGYIKYRHYVSSSKFRQVRWIFYSAIFNDILYSQFLKKTQITRSDGVLFCPEGCKRKRKSQISFGSKLQIIIRRQSGV